MSNDNKLCKNNEGLEFKVHAESNFNTGIGSMRIKTYGKALVCLGLIVSATLLEMNGHNTRMIWVLIVIWVLFGNF